MELSFYNPWIKWRSISYVTRVESTPKYQPETPYISFVDTSVDCDPHTGAAYVSDKRKVHQLNNSHLSTVIQQWIEPIQKKQDGRVSYEALKNNCLGTGNFSKRVTHAEKMKKISFILVKGEEISISLSRN